MSVDEAVKKATIPFPKGISLKEGEDLIEFVAAELPAEIRYTAYQSKTVTGTGKRKEVAMSHFSPKIEGTIAHKRKPATFDMFECLRNDSTSLTAIRFSTILGYDYEEHRIEVRELWDEVRGAVGKYFKRKEILAAQHRDRHRS